jgi:hypothetical protein
MNAEWDNMYEIWSTKSGDKWEFEAGSGSFEGAMQYAEYIEAKPSVKRVRIYLGNSCAYDSLEDKEAVKGG